MGRDQTEERACMVCPNCSLPTSPHTWTPQRWQLQQWDVMKIKKNWQREALLSCSFYLVAPF